MIPYADFLEKIHFLLFKTFFDVESKKEYNFLLLLKKHMKLYSKSMT